MPRSSWFASVALFVFAVPASAQTPAPVADPHAGDAEHEQHPPAASADSAPDVPAAETPPAGHDHGAGHHDHSGDIVVTGMRRNKGDVLGGISVLDGADLARELRPSLGETLARQPGVSSTSFGPVASRPILRGLSGERIRILTDGIGSFDVASSSVDHAVAINPLTAEKIEVLRGPSALMYGSSAIGGVVNVIDARIPRRAPAGAATIHGIFGYGSAAEERSVHAMGDVALGGGLVAHVDGNLMNSDDLLTGGYLLSGALRDEAKASASPEVRALAELKGKLPNTAARSAEISGGLAYVQGALNVGASITRHESRYGVPIRFSLDSEVEPEAPTIDMRQTRGDVRAEVPLGGFLSAINARGGIAKYRHDELEESGEIGSSFFSRGGEGRIELLQRARGGWGGTTGAQYLARSVRIAGAEKYLPDSRQRQFGLFTMQSLIAGPLRVEGGARIEFSRLGAKADDDLLTPAARRGFTTWSASLGGAYEFAPGWRGGLTFSRSARAPAIDELFANGPHAGTQAFEIGDPVLDPERSLSVEASVRRTAGPVRLTASLYYSRFSNFIFQAPTGAVADDLPVYTYREGRAVYYGAELEAQAQLGRALGIDLGGELVADALRATIADYGPAPQIPPLRVLGALTGVRGNLDGRLEVEHALAQRRTAPLETDTPAYTLVNVSLELHPLPDRPLVTLMASANNIFDVVARRHSSLLKDYAPLAGRDIRLSARISF